MIHSPTKRRLIALLAGLALGSTGFAQAQSTRFVFLTNWLAQAEHGGFYQASAEGLYKQQGLDVEIRMGGPQVNVMQLLLAGQADAVMGYDLQVIKGLEQGLPLITIGATFQKDPVVLIAHPPAKSLQDLRSRNLLIGQASETTFWPWAKAKYGYTDAQKRPYAFSVQPFLVDKNVVQQGYATSEPFSIEKAGIKPVVFLLADEGYPPYAQTIIVLTKTLKERPEVLKKFLQATAEGYKRYLGNPAPGNALIRRANPEMEEALLAFGVARMKQYALVTGGDAKTQGILTMTDARWKQTFDFLVDAGMVKPALDYRKAYSLDLIRTIKVLP